MAARMYDFKKVLIKKKNLMSIKEFQAKVVVFQEHKFWLTWKFAEKEKSTEK